MFKALKRTIVIMLLTFGCSNIFAKPLMVLTDIHFDPFLDCISGQLCPLIQKLENTDVTKWADIFEQESHVPISHYGQNTSYALLKSTLAEIKDINKNTQPAAVLILGDFFAHDFDAKYAKFSGDTTAEGYQLFAGKVMQFLTHVIKAQLPEIDVYPVVGNNDTYSRDYITLPNGKFFKDTAITWRAFINNKDNQESMMRDFNVAGYYSVKQPLSNHRIIVLNTVLFSPYQKGLGMEQDAQRELVWLDKQLTAAEENHEQVLLALHIPPGIDVYMTLHQKFRLTKTFWNEAYTEKFINILSNHATAIMGIITGHIHKDAYQILTLNDKEIPITYVPSVSPIYRNNPGIKIYEMDDVASTLNNFDTYYLAPGSEEHWSKEYNFNEKYQPYCSTCRLVEGFKKLKTSIDDQKAFYKTYYMVYANLEVLPGDFIYYHCADHEFLQAGYGRCLMGN